jgi:hypothetical protein
MKASPTVVDPGSVKTEALISKKTYLRGPLGQPHRFRGQRTTTSTRARILAARSRMREGLAVYFGLRSAIFSDGRLQLLTATTQAVN